MMLKVSVAAMVAAVVAIGFAVSDASAATTDSQTSTDNSKLSCKLDINVQGGKVTVSWTITGATKASIDPLTFKGGVPLKGSQTLDSSGPLTVFLVAEDGQGHTVHCTSSDGVKPSPGSPPVPGGDGDISSSKPPSNG